jgi:2'-5' RNA ligase
MRMFVQLDLPTKAKLQVQRAQHNLHGKVHANVKWVNDHHLTLRFLGEVAEPAVPDVARAVASLRAESFDLCIAGYVLLPPNGRTRVVAVGFEGELEYLRCLQAGVDRICAELGLPSEARPYTPHVTLGRVLPPKRIPHDIHAYFDPQLNRKLDRSRFRLTRVTLMKSILDCSGARHVPIAISELQDRDDQPSFVPRN